MAILAALVASITFGVAVKAGLRAETESCHRFGDLWGKCIAPQDVRAFLTISLFAISLITLVWLALHQTKLLDGN